MHFEISDPHATDGGIPRVYDTSTEAGGPDWHLLFKYLLQHCQHVHHYDTVYLLVDTRDLTKVEDVEPTLTHWPAVAAWWSSRLRYLGPGAEQVDLVFVRAAKSTGLHLVHPTWAMVFLFPSIHFVLLDSDCVPVTLLLRLRSYGHSPRKLSPLVGLLSNTEEQMVLLTRLARLGKMMKRTTKASELFFSQNRTQTLTQAW